jgi:hypothetical protein
MDSNNQPQGSLQMVGNIPIPSKKIILSAAAGIISMIISILLLVGLENMDDESGLVLLIPLFLVVLGSDHPDLDVRS